MWVNNVKAYQTCTSVPFLHPDVAVALSHSSLRVKKGHEDASLCTEPGIVAVALLHGIFVILLPHPNAQKNNKIWKLQDKKRKEHEISTSMSQFGAN